MIRSNVITERDLDHMTASNDFAYLYKSRCISFHCSFRYQRFIGVFVRFLRIHTIVFATSSATGTG